MFRRISSFRRLLKEALMAEQSRPIEDLVGTLGLEQCEISRGSPACPGGNRTSCNLLVILRSSAFIVEETFWRESDKSQGFVECVREDLMDLLIERNRLG